MRITFKKDGSPEEFRNAIVILLDRRASFIIGDSHRNKAIRLHLQAIRQQLLDIEFV